MRQLAALILLVTPGLLPAQALGPTPFDLEAGGRRDGNGFMLNPGWKTPADFRILDPMARCGIFALAGIPGYRNVLLRRDDCFSDAQRPLLRLNEARALRVFGGGCAQATADGSVQGHVNWFPITLTGSLHYNATSSPGVQNVGNDYDHTFELTGDSRLPVTRWNVDTRGPELEARLDPATASIHVEVDLRETTRRVLREWTGGGRWWGRLRELGDRRGGGSDEWAIGNDLVGLGRATVTGLFGLDIVHHGHAEIHPVFGMAILRRRTQTGGALEEEWVILARDRANEGNCAHGIVPLDLGGTPRALDTFRLRLPRPDTTAGRPTVEGPGRSWLAATEPVSGPEFWFTKEGDLDVVAVWPKPMLGNPDALLLGVITVRWPGRYPAALAAAKLDQPRFPVRKARKERRGHGKPVAAEVAYYAALPRRSPLEERARWSPAVRDEPQAWAPDTTLRAVPVLDLEPVVTACDSVAIKWNPRCVGTWSFVPGVGARVGGDTWWNALFALGVNTPHLAAGNLHPTYFLEYRRFSTLASKPRAEFLEFQAKVTAPACGNLSQLPGGYCLLQAGVGREWSGGGRWYFSPAVGLGVTAPAALRVRLAVEVQYRYLVRPGDNHSVVTAHFTLPVVVF